MSHDETDRSPAIDRLLGRVGFAVATCGAPVTISASEDEIREVWSQVQALEKCLLEATGVLAGQIDDEDLIARLRAPLRAAP